MRIVVVVVVMVVVAAAAAAVATVVDERIITCQQELGCGEQLGPSKRNVPQPRGGSGGKVWEGRVQSGTFRSHGAVAGGR
jgi:hypothetical protein